MPVVRQLPQEVAELEMRRADLARRIERLPRGASQRRRLEARQAEITRSLLVLETRLPGPTPANGPVPTDDDEPNLMWWQK